MKSSSSRQRRRTAIALSFTMFALSGASGQALGQNSGGFLGPPPGSLIGKGAKASTSKTAAKGQSLPATSQAQQNFPPVDNGGMGGTSSDLSGWTQPQGGQTSAGVGQSEFNSMGGDQSPGQSELMQPSGQNMSGGSQLGQSDLMQPSGNSGQAFTNNQGNAGTPVRQQAPSFGQVLDQEQQSNNSGMQQSAIQGSVQQNNMQGGGMAQNNMGGMQQNNMGGGMGGGMAGMLGTLMSGGMGQGGMAGMAGMMNFLQNVVPGAASTMQPNMGGTPGFPAPGSLGTPGTGTAPGGGDAGFPAPGSLGPPPGSGSGGTTGSDGNFVPMGASANNSNFVNMGQQQQSGGGNGVQIPRGVTNTVNRTSRQVGQGVNYMLQRAIYKGLYNVRF